MPLKRAFGGSKLCGRVGHVWPGGPLLGALEHESLALGSLEPPRGANEVPTYGHGAA